MPPSFLKLLKDNHQSITLGAALTHLELIKAIKAHCLFNADLKELSQEGFQGKHTRNQIEEEMNLQAVKFYIWTRKAIDEVRLLSWDDPKKKNILDTRLDPESWLEWLKTYKMDRRTKEYMREIINAVLSEIEDALEELPTLYPERYEVCNLSGKCDQEREPAKKNEPPESKFVVKKSTGGSQSPSLREAVKEEAKRMQTENPAMLLIDIVWSASICRLLNSSAKLDDLDCWRGNKKTGPAKYKKRFNRTPRTVQRWIASLR